MFSLADSIFYYLSFFMNMDPVHAIPVKEDDERADGHGFGGEEMPNLRLRCTLVQYVFVEDLGRKFHFVDARSLSQDGFRFLYASL